jgi:hypothetical protein
MKWHPSLTLFSLRERGLHSQSSMRMVLPMVDLLMARTSSFKNLRDSSPGGGIETKRQIYIE